MIFSKYIQTHFFDLAFGERSGSVVDTGTQVWTGRDDMIELYLRDWDHLKACFGSEYVRKTVGPVGANFNDLKTMFPLMAAEKELEFESAVAGPSETRESSRTVAVLFLASTSKDTKEQLEQSSSPALVKALQA